MKHSYLNNPTRPIEVGEKTVGELLSEMRYTGFQARKLGESVDVWANMLMEDKLSVFLGLSGAMVPVGMRRIISYLVKKRYIDCLVSTGANLFHDLHEALGGSHYLGSENADDGELFRHSIDRIHDVFAPEDRFRELDRWTADFAKGLKKDHRYSSRELMYQLGKEVSGIEGIKDSIIVSACNSKVPVYVPAIADSSFGIGLTTAMREGQEVHVDHLKDVDEITTIVENSEKTGVVYIGGGVPKNFIQQTEIVASIHGKKEMGHEFAIQFTTDSPQFGGLSGCTFNEAVSWGKISTHAKMVQVFADASISLPLVSCALYEKMKDKIEDRAFPKFDVSGEELKMSF